MRRGKGEEQAWNKTQIPHSDLQTFTRACLSLHLNQYAYWPQLLLFIFLSILHCFLFSVLGLDAPFVWGVLPHALFMAGFFLPFRSHLNLTSEKPSLTIQYKEPIVFYFARSHVSTDFLAYCFSFSTRISPL